MSSARVVILKEWCVAVGCVRSSRAGNSFDFGKAISMPSWNRQRRLEVTHERAATSKRASQCKIAAGAKILCA
jgi:hypothetical protein